MVKLNQHGWGVREMILLSAILLAFLLVTVFMVSRLYQGVTADEKDSGSDYSYREVEENLLDAGISYYEDYYSDEEQVIVTSSTLIRHQYLHSRDLKAKGESHSCSGYVKFLDGKGKAYITCSDYETSGYEDL